MDYLNDAQSFECLEQPKQIKKLNETNKKIKMFNFVNYTLK